jgi:hypothetical protein
MLSNAAKVMIYAAEKDIAQIGAKTVVAAMKSASKEESARSKASNQGGQGYHPNRIAADGGEPERVMIGVVEGGRPAG